MKNIQVTGNLFGEMTTLKQINIVKAKKLYADGITVFIQSSNKIPFQPYQSVCPISNHLFNCMHSFDTDSDLSFKSQCESYSYYNCDTERGTYIHYFEKI